MKPKVYESVRDFERQTSYCPLYLAWHVVDEARDYFRTPISEAFADELARRAEIVFGAQPFWQRRFKGARGRAAILTAMRHWLAGILARENPALFRQLPESFKVGHPLPEYPGGPHSSDVRRLQNTNAIAARFVHGCELLMA